PSPAGRARTSRCALVFASRGPVAKNAPQERFLYAPADDAPKKSRSEDRDFLLRHPLRGGLARRAARSCSPRGDRSLKTLRRSVFYTRPLMTHQKSPGRKTGIFCCAIPCGAGSHVALRARVRLAGTGR